MFIFIDVEMGLFLFALLKQSCKPTENKPNEIDTTTLVLAVFFSVLIATAK